MGRSHFMILLMSASLGLFGQEDTVSSMPATDVYAAFPMATDDGFSWQGSLLTDDRLTIRKGNQKFDFQEYRLSLQPRYTSARLALNAEIWVRSFRYPVLSSYMDLSDKQKVVPIGMDLREASMDVYDFLVPGLDLRIGRQRIAWGAADRICPTDNMNPYDLEDIWDFGRHLPSNSLKLTWYKQGFTMSGILTPRFTPSLAPAGAWMEAMVPAMSLPSSIAFLGMPWQLSLQSLEDSLLLPTSDAKESLVYGLKMQRNLGIFTASVSYAHTYDMIPLPYRATIIPVAVSADTMTYDLQLALRYHRLKVLGFDIAGSIRNVGVWAEAALSFPEEIKLSTRMNFLGTEVLLSDSLIQDDQPFLKVVAGLDYTFRNNLYINFQYIYGFVHERGRDALNHYFVLHAEWKAMRDRLKIAPLDICLQINEFKEINKHHAMVFLPSITYLPADNVEIGLGARWIEGTTNTLFGQMKDQSHLYLRCMLSF